MTWKTPPTQLQKIHYSPGIVIIVSVPLYHNPVGWIFREGLLEVKDLLDMLLALEKATTVARV
ncbi:hypothetical protein CHS0354_002837 [Potamilus streckersoni]|uniref:Uncharacterized protein n=1 Tax=Potamilus streckersoni TaxID=2493646 RepID=A0AAE0RMK7_9BIVA|nr:hypothetical protein CHS0354_002837 [Potamilus streckersoni]